MQTNTIEKLQQIIEKQRARIAELEELLVRVRDVYDNLTVPQFHRGADKPVRDAVNKALAKSGTS